MIVLEKILVSACLLGENVKYNGSNNKLSHPLLEKWLKEGRIVSICPESEGGLPTPRHPSEIQGSKVVNTAGEDVTDAFISGAEIACKKALDNNIRFAILKQGSPSCGSSAVYDGSFSGTKIAGMGIAASMLSSMGVLVFDENDIDSLAKLVRQ